MPAVVSGVPQGSGLGPIQIIIYINDLKNMVKTCNTGNFADDTEMQGKVATIQEDLENFLRY